MVAPWYTVPFCLGYKFPYNATNPQPKGALVMQDGYWATKDATKLDSQMDNVELELVLLPYCEAPQSQVLLSAASRGSAAEVGTPTLSLGFKV